LVGLIISVPREYERVADTSPLRLGVLDIDGSDDLLRLPFDRLAVTPRDHDASTVVEFRSEELDRDSVHGAVTLSLDSVTSTDSDTDVVFESERSRLSEEETDFVGMRTVVLTELVTEPERSSVRLTVLVGRDIDSSSLRLTE
jgi:hypothetical protein